MVTLTHTFVCSITHARRSPPLLHQQSKRSHPDLVTHHPLTQQRNGLGGWGRGGNQANDLANNPQVNTQITSTLALRKASGDLGTEGAFRRGDETSSRKRKRVQVTQRSNAG